MPPRKVLIVDDEPYILQILAFKLRRAGYTAIEAATAEEAEQVMQQTAVDCLVLDVGLGAGATGFQLAARMQRHPELSRLPIIFLTARSLPGDLLRGEELGCRAYITKPFSLDDVIAEVERQLDGRHDSA